MENSIASTIGVSEWQLSPNSQIDMLVGYFAGSRIGTRS